VGAGDLEQSDNGGCESEQTGLHVIGLLKWLGIEIPVRWFRLPLGVGAGDLEQSNHRGCESEQTGLHAADLLLALGAR
jgi:hypothetical protein